MKNILLIDDDIDEIELLKEAVSEIAPETRCHYALNGQEALELITSESFEKPDLIFLDINMPVMNGWEFLRKIKGNGHLRNIPVIVCSTSNQELDRRKADDLGARHYINKPEDYRLLKKELSAWLLKVEENVLNIFAGLFYRLLPGRVDWGRLLVQSVAGKRI